MSFLHFAFNFCMMELMVFGSLAILVKLVGKGRFLNLLDLASKKLVNNLYSDIKVLEESKQDLWEEIKAINSYTEDLKSDGLQLWTDLQDRVDAQQTGIDAVVKAIKSLEASLERRFEHNEPKLATKTKKVTAKLLTMKKGKK